MISTAEETASNAAPGAEAQPRASKKASGAKKRADVAKTKGKSGKKASQVKKPPKGAKKAKSGRKDSKTNQVLDLLRQPGGVTAKELMETTGWQAHSVRGFLSGTVAKKMGLTVTSSKSEHGERSYSIKG
jgi:Protein of unknown function (DUF3489)